MSAQTVIVIGAGILGVSTAEWLRRGGAAVTLIDRNPPGDPEAASYGNAGLLARAAVVPVSVPGLLGHIPKMLLSADEPLFMRWRYLPKLAPWLIPFLRNGTAERATAISKSLTTLLFDSVDQHYALTAGTDAAKYIRTGEYTYLYRDRAAFERDAFGWSLRRDAGFHWIERDRAALVAADPHLGTDYGFGAALQDHGWITNPGAYVAALAAHFSAQGGRFRRAAARTVIPLEGGRARVETDSGPLEADRVVVACGAWSDRLTASLGHKAMLESERGYHFIIKGATVDGQPLATPHPYMVTDAKMGAAPMEMGLRFAGMVEFGGADAPASQKPIALFKRKIARVYPNVRWEAEESWMGRRPSTPDSLPLIGPAPKAPQIYFAFGNQHIGLTSGPKTGRLIADMILGRPSNEDLTPFRVGRFD